MILSIYLNGVHVNAIAAIKSYLVPYTEGSRLVTSS